MQYHPRTESAPQGAEGFGQEGAVGPALQPRLSDPEVEAVLSHGARVAAGIDDHGQAPLRAQASTGRVQEAFPHRDPHAVSRQVAQSQDSRPVGNYRESRQERAFPIFLNLPRIDDGPEPFASGASSVLRRQVQTSRPRQQRAPVGARVGDSGSVHQRQEESPVGRE